MSAFIKGDLVVWSDRGEATVIMTGSADGLVMVKLDADGRLWRKSTS
jgi:hypothetical protein